MPGGAISYSPVGDRRSLISACPRFPRFGSYPRCFYLEFSSFNQAWMLVRANFSPIARRSRQIMGKKEKKMSTPSAPYYHKTNGDTYHWETSCSKNHYPASGWERTNTKPNKEQCNECKGK